MIKKILGVVATAAIALGATSAQAVTFSGDNTYIGDFSTDDGAGFSHFSDIPSPTFSETWIFSVSNPYGLSLVSNVNYLTGTGITNFKAELFNVTGTPSCSITCSGVFSLGSSLGVFPGAGTRNYEITTSLAQNYYAIVVSGSSNGSSQNSYSGQMAFSVPEPATMGLFGLGLAAVGFVRRRRIAA